MLNNANSMNDTQLLDLVRKSLSTDSSTGVSIQPFMKEDLEDEAYLTLYTESDTHQMAFLKDLPRQDAEQILHQFTIVDRYGNHKAKASFSPNGLPSSANIDGSKKNVQLKVYGKTTAIQGLTVLQNTIKALGQSDIAQSNHAAVKQLLMYQINQEMVGSDTRDTLDGNQFKGILQQIDELTRAPTATTKFSNTNYFYDLRGQPLTAQLLRQVGVGMNKRNSVLRRVYMAPEALESIENTLDPAARIQIGSSYAQNNKGVILGGTVDGMRIQGTVCYFRRDAALSSSIRTGLANYDLIPGAPSALAFGGSGAGTISQPAVNVSSSVSQFAPTGNRLTGMYYIVTAVNEIGESIASNVSASINATPNKTIEFTITPRADALSFRIYRGYVNDNGQPGTFLEPKIRDAYFIGEIPNGVAAGNTAPLLVVDSNQFMPGCTIALGGDINSDSAASLDQGQMPSSPENKYTVGKSAWAIAKLTGLFEFDLAKLGWLYDNKLFAQVLSPMVPRPNASVVFLNVGGVEIQNQLFDRQL
jgi:hypothetical protein